MDTCLGAFRVMQLYPHCHILSATHSKEDRYHYCTYLLCFWL